MAHSSPRLYVHQTLGPGAAITFTPKQAHYLRNVMRLNAKSSVIVFNGRHGEWQVDQLNLAQRQANGLVTEKIRNQQQLNGPDLYFAPVKKAGTDFIASKATELGACSLNPIITDFTSTVRVNQERILANAKEAAEQCGRLDIPRVGAPTRLQGVLEMWPGSQLLVVADTTKTKSNALDTLTAVKTAKNPPAFLIGPQGGFSETELVFLYSLPFVIPIGLGPRILRSETAVVAVLTCWQATRGDWI